MVDKAQDTIPAAHDLVTDVLGLVPATAGGFADKLSQASHASLDRLAEIVSRPLDWNDPKQVRLIGDMAQATLKLFMRAAEGEFKARRDDVLVKLLEQLQAPREGGKDGSA